MRFKPKTKEELASMSVVPAGLYHFKVTDAVDQVSRSGNEMIRLSLGIDNGGSIITVFDYLLEAMATKLYDFCDATSLLHHYNQGTLRPSDCVGKTGVVEIVIDKGKEKPEGGFYPDKNSVKKYMAKDNVSSTPIKGGGTFIDDDVPF